MEMTSMEPIDPHSHVHEVSSVSWPTSHNITEIYAFQSAGRLQQKPMPTKEMMTEAIKTLSKGRKPRGFSFLGLRKYIFENFLQSKRELIRRMVFVKRFFKEAVETGELETIKGTGLNGSFRVPPTSTFRKIERKIKPKPKPNPLKSLQRQKAKKVNRKVNKSVTKNVNRKMNKKANKKTGAKTKKSAKLKKTPKRLNRKFSSN